MKINGYKNLFFSKFVGKVAKVAGWAWVAYDVEKTAVSEYNNKDSRAYKSLGKSIIHAGVDQLKNVGPIEGAWNNVTSFFGGGGQKHA